MFQANELIIVGGPTAVGKSTLLGKIEQGDLSKLREQLRVESPSSYLYHSAMELEQVGEEPVDKLFIHYDFLHWYLTRGAFEYLPDWIFKNSSITVLTLCVPSNVLVSRISSRITKTFISLLYKPKIGQMKRLHNLWEKRKFYRNVSKILALYEEWANLMSNKGITEHLIVNPLSSDTVIARPYEYEELRKMLTNVVDEKKVRIALVGAGNFVQTVHIPNLKKLSHLFNIRAVVTNSQTTGERIKEMIPVGYATQDLQTVLDDPEVDAIVIATRHNLHTEQINRALDAGKKIFCEKPMTLNAGEALAIARKVKEKGADLMIGFNRRSAPIIQELKHALRDIPGPWLINYYWANKPWGAGWPFDPVEGGGKIFSCGSHVMDVIHYIIGKFPVRVTASGGNFVYPEIKTEDSATLLLEYSDGSSAAVQFTDMGAESMPQERLTVFTPKGVAVLDNFKELIFHGMDRRNIVLKEQDRGGLQELHDFHRFVTEGTSPPANAAAGYVVTAVCEAAVQSMKTGSSVTIGLDKSVLGREYF